MNNSKIIAGLGSIISHLERSDLIAFTEDIKQSLTSNRNNVVVIKDLLRKLNSRVRKIDSNQFREEADKFLKTGSKFETKATRVSIQTLVNGKATNGPSLISSATKLIQALVDSYNDTISNAKYVKQLLTYYEEDKTKSLPKGKSEIALIFKHVDTTENYEELTKILAKWQTALRVYHQLISSKSPNTIVINKVDNNSIDFFLFLDTELVKNLLELFKVGFEYFGAYLTYKETIGKIIKSFRGNKKLIEGEVERESELINNVSEAIRKELQRQHKEAKTKDKNIASTSIKVSLDIVTSTIQEHIVKGNDFKLIEAPKSKKEMWKDDSENRDLLEQIEENLQKLKEGEKKKLINQFVNDKEDKDELKK